jgi:hypothetical protein
MELTLVFGMACKRGAKHATWRNTSNMRIETKDIENLGR